MDVERVREKCKIEAAMLLKTQGRATIMKANRARTKSIRSLLFRKRTPSGNVMKWLFEKTIAWMAMWDNARRLFHSGASFSSLLVDSAA